MIQQARRRALLHPILALVAATATGALVVASQQTSPSEAVITVRVTGSVVVHERSSDNFLMTNQTLGAISVFSQALDFRVVRVPSGFGGAPTGLLWAQSAYELTQPIVALVGPMTRRISGEMEATTCGRQSRPRLSVREGLPTVFGKPIPVQTSAIDRGTFYVQGCPSNSDRLLVFYLPPPSFYAVPADGPVKCNEEYTFHREEGGGVLFDPSLIEGVMKQKVAQDCSGGGRRDAAMMVYMGGVSWRELTGGQTVILRQTATGIDGDPKAESEPYRLMRVDITMELSGPASPGGPLGGPIDALIAVITAPDVNRGATLIADGSASRAPKGSRIVSYEWTFTPQACSVTAETVQMTGVQARFTAVCPMVAKLKVTDDRGRTAEAVKLIDVGVPTQ